ncbi:Glycoside hydrolase family 3 domain protein [Verrucomicrobia bacterium]|nr:Glycoside hydrolase family 3 domain protein [Verrucomicrobiota bacterium]
MNCKQVFITLGMLAILGIKVDAQDAAAQKAEALLSQMTLEEKIGQMTQIDMNALKDKADIKNYFIGSMLSGGDSDPPDITAAGWAKAVEEYQSWAFKTRLKIPLIYGIDAVHGHNNVDGAVIFPHHIGMGATRNPALIERAARVTAQEVAATGIRWAFAPCLAVARNPRWGRTYESFGDSPEVVELLGAAEVRGLQDDWQTDSTPVLACAKHFLGDGGTHDGIDQGDTECDEATLRKIHLPGYVSAIKAGVGSVMVSYSSWNGKKMHGNHYLLTDVLKKELGFEGFVVSDWAAIDQLSSDYKSDIETSINAGLDMVMIPNGPGKPNNYAQFTALLKELVLANRVPQSRIDDAVRRILRIKYKLGLFDEPFADRRLVASVGSPEHRQVARECVQQSLVLLKNPNHVLPLSKSLKRLHVAGQAANDLGIQCGGWTIDWQGRAGEVTRGGTTILAAIRRTVATGTEVTYSTGGAEAKGADAAVVVIGEMPYAEMKGDRGDLRVSPQDIALVQEVKRLGIPVITVLLSGRPLILGRALEFSDAFLAAWLPGTEGQGVADVLFGDYRPTGKLPCNWLASMEELSPPGVTATRHAPLFAYGFGLTYESSRAAR